MNLQVTRRQDKRRTRVPPSFVAAVQQGNPSPIPLDEVLEVSRVSIEVLQALFRVSQDFLFVQSARPTRCRIRLFEP